MTKKKHPLNQEQDDLYKEIGFALSQWNMVEDQVFQQFCNFMACPTWHASSAAFFAIKNFGARLDMVDAAAQVALSGREELLKKWLVLCAEMRKKAAIRNKIVHFIVITEIDGKPERRVYLIPSFMNVHTVLPKKGKKVRSQKPKYTVAQVERFRKDFGKLNVKLIKFERNLSPVRERLLEAAEAIRERPQKSRG